MRIALIPLKTDVKEPVTNLDHLTRRLAEVARWRPDLVCLPECTLTGYLYEEGDLTQFAETIPGPTTARMAQLAKQHGVYLCFGMVERAEEGIYNTAVLLDRTGRIILTHRKVQESAPFLKGDRVARAEVEGRQVAVIICGDLFHEQVIAQLDHTLDLLIVPMSRSFADRSPDIDRWLGEERQAYLDAVKAVAVRTVIVNALENVPAEGSFGGALVVGADGVLLAESPHGTDQPILWDLEAQNEAQKMADKLSEFQRADTPLPDRNRLWPLYGAGLDNLGQEGQPIEVPLPAYGPDELLVRHDACGLCFSDIKVIKLGEEHPRIYRNMRTDPVVLGHEVSLTVVGVGQNLRDRYHVGDRFIVQADIFVGGVGYAYGYEIQGGLSQYGVVDRRILHGDHGCYLIPVQPGTGYAEAALTEPWACVIAAYGLTYRTGLKPGGVAWFIGAHPLTPTRSPEKGASQPPSPFQGEGLGVRGYTFSVGFDEHSHPARLLLTNVPAGFAAWLRERAAALGIEVAEVADVRHPPVTAVDDIILLGADPNLVEAASPFLADFGVFAIIADEPMPRRVAVDVGRVHYNRWLYVGGRGPDIARAYSDVPVRAALRPGGRTWFVGAGGPMGRMHVQRALEIADGPATILCTDVSNVRLEDLRTTFAAEAEAKGIEWLCLNPTDREAYEAAMARFREQGFDDIIVLAPVPAVIADAATYLAPQGVMNIFAGVGRGTLADLDLSAVYLHGVRFIGHSASTIDDLRLMLHQAESGVISPNRAVAAIGSLSAARDGLRAVQEATFPGKIVIYPHIKEMPLTGLPELKDRLPSVYARLKDGREWTVEAEREFLRLMLP